MNNYFPQIQTCIFLLAVTITSATCSLPINLFAPQKDVEQYRIVHSSLPLQLKWQTDVSENIWNPVLLDESNIYVRSRSTVYAINKVDGKSGWQQFVGDASGRYDPGRIMVIGDGTVITTVDQESVIKAFRKRDGSLLWQFGLHNELQSTSINPFVTQLLVDKEKIYALIGLARGVTVVAINLLDGSLIWQSPPEIQGDIALAIYHQPEAGLLAIATGLKLYLLDESTGKPIHQFPGSIFLQGIPSYENGIVYTFGETVQAIRLQTMDVLWQFKDDCPDPQDRIGKPPLIINNSIFVIATCGKLYQLNAKTGIAQWQYTHEEKIRAFTTFSTTGYILSANGSVKAVKLDTGELIDTMVVEPERVPASKEYVQQSAFDYLISDKELLTLTYGNTQLFAFVAQ